MNKNDNPHWITHDRYQVKCSECGTIFRSEMFQIKRKGEYVWDIEESKFCPRCGVKMGGNDDEQDR